MTHVAPQALVAEGNRVDPAPDGIKLMSEEVLLTAAAPPPPPPPTLSHPSKIPCPHILLDLLPCHASHLMHVADNPLVAAKR